MLSLEAIASLLENYRSAAAARVREFTLGDRLFAFNQRPAVMGVINLSEESWYRESVCLTSESALQRGKILQAQGADIVDLGAESSLARAARVGEKEQTKVLLPVIQALAQQKIVVSVETYDPAVSEPCLKAGALVLNLTGNAHGDTFFRQAAHHRAAVIVCYVQGKNVREVEDYHLTPDPIGPMYEFFSRQVETATKAGLDRLLLDPGLGFYYRNLQDSSLRVRFQMTTFLNTFRLRSLGFPVCHALPHAFEYFGEEVRSAEPFFAVLAALGKTDLFRTHEVSKTKAVLNTLSLLD